jgi:hypothetical protein
MSYTRTEDGISLVTEVRVLKGLFGSDFRSEMGFESSEEDGMEWTSDDGGGEDGDGGDEEHTENQGHGTFYDKKAAMRSESGLFTPPPDSCTRARPLSLPASPRDGKFEGDLSIPISWTDTTSLVGTKPRCPNPRLSPRPKSTEATGEGRKRCLQLDLRGVGEGDMATRNDYHMGEST